ESQYRTKLKKWKLRKPRIQRKQSTVKTDFAVLPGAPTPALQTPSGFSSTVDCDNTLAMSGPSMDLLPSSPGKSSYISPAQFHHHSNQPEFMGVVPSPATQVTPYHLVEVNNRVQDLPIDKMSNGATFANLQHDTNTISGRSTSGAMGSYHGALILESSQSPRYPQPLLHSFPITVPDASTCSPFTAASPDAWPPTTGHTDPPLSELESQASWWQPESSSDPYVSPPDMLSANPYEAPLLY
ncbi:MAG: hypothetical protein Q9174_006880, partial [Haloplaca sp. 1 TL-2023]